MILACFELFFLPKIAKKCGLLKKKSHFISRSSLICDIEKLPIQRFWIFLGYLNFKVFRSLKIGSLALNYEKN
jgi:hypothetical protein